VRCLRRKRHISLVKSVAEIVKGVRNMWDSISQ